MVGGLSDGGRPIFVGLGMAKRKNVSEERIKKVIQLLEEALRACERALNDADEVMPPPHFDEQPRILQ
jgi:hypothetical protein